MDFLNPKKPAVILAPMEGVTDAPFREFITQCGDFDYCVSEFIRVSGNSLLPKTFQKHIPELKQNSRTLAQIPVQIQLLGGNAERMAESARNATLAGARGVDINFGCPAPTVNRHDGGATLLKYPHRIEEIVRAIRDAVPSEFPVSAKLRLGFDDPNAIDENSKRAEQGGASWITIHGRTKTQGYIPPAYWKPIGKAARGISIPVVANGEIWNLEDFRRCQDETGSIHFMLGRGALAVPHLAREIRKELGLERIQTPNPLHFPIDGESRTWAALFREYAQFQPSEKRLKQWARYLHSRKTISWWDEIKGLDSSEGILNYLEQRSEAPSSFVKAEGHPSQSVL